MAGGSYIPDISGINSNCALYFPNEDEFIDLNTLGAASGRTTSSRGSGSSAPPPVAGSCSGRWTPDRPASTTAPTSLTRPVWTADPEEVAEVVRTWDSWIELGERLRRDSRRGSGQQRDHDVQPVHQRQRRAVLRHRRQAPVRRTGQRRPQGLGHCRQGGSGARSPETCRSPPTRTPAGSSWQGRRAHRGGVVGRDPGRHRTGHEGEVAAGQPAGSPGNSGGSFLAVPATCKDPEAAFAFLSWLTTPQNQAVTFNDVQLFPSTPASFTGGQMASDTGFFGPQDPLDVLRTGRRVRARRRSSAPTSARPRPSRPSWPTSRPAARTRSRPGTRPSTETDKILAKRGVL